MLGLFLDLLQSMLWLAIAVVMFLGYVALTILRLALPPLARLIGRALRKNPPRTAPPTLRRIEPPFPPPATPKTPIPDLPKYRPYRH